MDVSWDEDYIILGRKWFQQSFYDDYFVGGEFQVIFNIGEWNSLCFGLNYMEDNYIEGNYFFDDCWYVIMGWVDIGWQFELEYVVWIYVIVMEDQFKFIDRFMVFVGLSYDNFKLIKIVDQLVFGIMDIVNFQVGVVFDMIFLMQFYVLLGKKICFFSLKEFYSIFGGGNFDFDSEKIIVYELGGFYIFFLIMNGDVVFFYYDIDDFIDIIRIDNNSVYININKVIIYGVEVFFEMKFFDVFKVGFNYIYFEIRDKFNNDCEFQGCFRYCVNFEIIYCFLFGFMVNVQVLYSIW